MKFSVFTKILQQKKSLQVQMRCCSHLSLQALNCLVYVVRYTIKVFGLLTAVEAAEPTDHAAADADRHIWRDIAVSVSYVGILAVQCDFYRRQYHIRLVFLSSLYIFLSFGGGDVAAGDRDLYVFH